MAQIQVNDLVAFVRAVEQQKGKYIKLVLGNLEVNGKLDPQVRKHILDGMNGFARGVYRVAGYELDE